MGEPTPSSLPLLFEQLAELDDAEREQWLAGLERSAPARAAELRSLFALERSAGDFLGLLSDRRRAPAAPVPHLLARSGELIGPYRLERELGRGGMGVVWLATDERLARPVALKLFGPRTPGDSLEGRRRMLAEARAAGGLDHPHVVPVHDVGERPDGVAYLAMAWCEGGSLAARLARGRLSLDHALRLGRQLASALSAAHERGLVHRDVKPANVLFDRAGQVRLADFGIAVSLGSPEGDTSRVLGTLAYAAPERLLGSEPDHRADLWSLGVTLYQALAGRRPFQGPSPASLLHEIVHRPPAPFDPELAVPKAVEALVFELLEKDPARRPRSAAVALDRLRQARHAIPARRPTARPPMPPTPLVGRARELARGSAALGESRLVTLTGPGGTGKTRLALELARLHEARHSDGACFVSLAPLTDPSRVPNEVADALGLEERGPDQLADRVRGLVSRSDLLLVLDNCEHLPGVGAFVASLLAASPRLTVLATSRAPLGVQGERELPVPPLGLPDPAGAGPASVRDAEAVQLFLERAAAGAPMVPLTDQDLGDVAAVCRRLDGLPLAIELAAARVRTLTPADLLTRLADSTEWLRATEGDRPERHRTLSEALHWSYALLAPSEQRLFRALSVCSGGFDGAAPAALLGESASPAEAEARLESLVGKSLVVVRRRADGSLRFDLLQTIRDFARRELQAAGEEALVRRRHAAHQLALAEAAAARLRGPEQARWQARLREEQPNVRSALAFLIGDDDLLAAVRLVIAMHRHWLVASSYLREVVALVRDLDRRIRAGRPDLVDPGLHAELLMVLGALTGISGEHLAVPLACYRAALDAARRAGHPSAEARALNHVGWTSLVVGRYDEARAASEQALALHRERGDVPGIATSLVNLGWVALSRAAIDEAERCFREALELQRALGDLRSIAYAEGHLATTAFFRGDAAGALEAYDRIRPALEELGDQLVVATFATRRALASHAGLGPEPAAEPIESELLPRLRESGAAWSVGFALAALGRTRLDAGELAGARAALEESLSVRGAAGIESGVAESETWLAETALAAGGRDEAARRFALSLELRRRLGEPLGLVHALEGIAGWLLEGGDAEGAIALLAGAGTARTGLGAERTPREQIRCEALEARAAAALDRRRCVLAVERGAAMSLDELARRALAGLAS